MLGGIKKKLQDFIGLLGTNTPTTKLVKALFIGGVSSLVFTLINKFQKEQQKKAEMAETFLATFITVFVCFMFGDSIVDVVKDILL